MELTMITLGVTVTITSDGKLLVNSPVDIPKWEYKQLPTICTPYAI